MLNLNIKHLLLEYTPGLDSSIFHNVTDSPFPTLKEPSVFRDV